MYGAPNKRAQREADLWNRENPVGVPVRVYPGAFDGRSIETRTRTDAQVMGGHTAVVWVEGEPGCFSLTHVVPIR